MVIVNGPLSAGHQPSFPRYFAIDRHDAEEAAELPEVLRHSGWQLATVDALIATVALRNRLILLTTDGDFSAVVHLQQENWLADLFV